MDISVLEQLLRVGLTFVLALVVGLERQLSFKAVGFGTYILVATGSSIFVLVASLLSDKPPLFVLGGIISSIGFLGAGALIKGKDKVSGFTTASILWAMACLGVTIGLGLYELSLLLYLGIWSVIVFDKLFEKLGLGGHYKILSLTISSIDALGKVEKALEEHSFKRRSIEFNGMKKEVKISYYLGLRWRHIKDVMESLHKIPEIEEIKVE